MSTVTAVSTHRPDEATPSMPITIAPLDKAGARDCTGGHAGRRDWVAGGRGRWQKLRRRTVVLLVAGGIGLLGAGCTSGPTRQVPVSPSSSAAISSPPDPARSSPAPEGPPDDGEQDVVPRTTRSTQPVWDEAARRNALGRAGTVMRLFSRRDVSAEQWWKDLSPYLSSQAQQDYIGIDPGRVPVHRITGQPRLVAPDTTRIARVHVPTDAGLYLVLMSRTPEDPPWRVEQIAPPEDTGNWP